MINKDRLELVRQAQAFIYRDMKVIRSDACETPKLVISLKNIPRDPDHNQWNGHNGDGMITTISCEHKSPGDRLKLTDMVIELLLKHGLIGMKTENTEAQAEENKAVINNIVCHKSSAVGGAELKIDEPAYSNMSESIVPHDDYCKSIAKGRFLLDVMNTATDGSELKEAAIKKLTALVEGL